MWRQADPGDLVYCDSDSVANHTGRSLPRLHVNYNPQIQESVAPSTRTVDSAGTSFSKRC